MAKITQAEVEDLRKAKKVLEQLQTQLGAGDSASQYLAAVTSTGSAFGALDGNGQKIGEFIQARQEAVNKAVVVKGTPGVAAAINLLQLTISNYENTEKANKAAADATPAGKSQSSGTNAGTKHPGKEMN